MLQQVFGLINKFRYTTLPGSVQCYEQFSQYYTFWLPVQSSRVTVQRPGSRPDPWRNKKCSKGCDYMDQQGTNSLGEHGNQRKSMTYTGLRGWKNSGNQSQVYHKYAIIYFLGYLIYICTSLCICCLFLSKVITGSVFVLIRLLLLGGFTWNIFSLPHFS